MTRSRRLFLALMLAPAIGLATVEISMMHWQGLTELKPDSYTPLALMNEDPPGIQVNAASP